MKNEQSYLRIGILATALLFGGNFNNASALEKIAETSQKQAQLDDKKEISTAELIKKATLEESLKFVEKCRDNSPFKQQIKKYGLERTAEHVAKLKSYSTDLAEKYSDNNSIIPEKDYELIAIKIGEDQNSFYEDYTNPLANNVIEARINTLKPVIEFKRKLISKNNSRYKKENTTKQYHQIIKNTFTKEEYAEYCNKMADLMDEYYNELGKTLGWKIVFGKNNLDKMKNATRENYSKSIDKIYK